MVKPAGGDKPPKKDKDKDGDGEGDFVFRRFFTDRNGVIRDAHKYGKKAWKIPVKKPKNKG